MALPPGDRGTRRAIMVACRSFAPIAQVRQSTTIAARARRTGPTPWWSIDADGRPDWVICEHCRSEHNYRGGPRVDLVRAPRPPRQLPTGLTSLWRRRTSRSRWSAIAKGRRLSCRLPAPTISNPASARSSRGGRPQPGDTGRQMARRFAGAPPGHTWPSGKVLAD